MKLAKVYSQTAHDYKVYHILGVKIVVPVHMFRAIWEFAQSHPEIACQSRDCAMGLRNLEIAQWWCAISTAAGPQCFRSLSAAGYAVLPQSSRSGSAALPQSSRSGSAVFCDVYQFKFQYSTVCSTVLPQWSRDIHFYLYFPRDTFHILPM